MAVVMQHPIAAAAAARTGSGWCSPAAVTWLRTCMAQPDVSDDALSKAVRACSAQELAQLGLAPPPAPTLALSSSTSIAQLTMAERLVAVQGVINALAYNLSLGYNFDAGKKRPLHAILTTAVGMLLHPLPVKCIEAVFLGLLLTQGWTQLQRLPLGFKSRGTNGVYRHIVLAVTDDDSNAGSSTAVWGALGISRCSTLMDKPLQHSSLAALVKDFLLAYRHVHHELVKVRVGLPVEHDPGWTGPVCWRYCTVSRVSKRPWTEVADALNQHAAQCAELQQRFRAVLTQGTRGGSSSSSSSPRRCGPQHAATPRAQSPVVMGAPTTPRSPRRGLQQHLASAPPSPRRQCVHAAENEAGSNGDDDDDDASDAEVGAIVASLTCARQA